MVAFLFYWCKGESFIWVGMHTFGFLPMKEDYSMGAQHQRDTLSMTAMPGTSLSR